MPVFNNQILAGSSAAVSAETDENTVLLIRSNTTNGSTTFEDVSQYGHTLTAHNDVEHSTAQYKMGTSSIYMYGSAEYVLAPAHSAFRMATDWTVEFWIRPWETQNNAWYFEIYNGTSTGFNNISMYHESSTIARGNLESHGGNNNFFLSSGWDTINTWHHYAMVRRKSTGYITIYINGTGTGEYFSTASWFPAGNPNIVMGNRSTGSAAGGQNLGGWYDEFKVSNVARYTSNFTPSGDFDYGLT